MSTSLLYHGFGIRGYKHVSTEFSGGTVTFTITQDRLMLRCSECNSRHVICKGTKTRLYRMIPIGTKKVFLKFAIQRILCCLCGVIRQVRVGFADSRFSYTKGFERHVLELSAHMTIRDVAHHLGISWDVVKEIQKKYLHKKFSRPKLNNLRQLAIDEISIGKGHKYVTIVLDLVSGAVVYVGKGKGADALKAFWRRLMRSGARIDAVAMDMSPSYRAAVSENLPEAAIVFDHFHIIKLFNDKLSDYRRQLYYKVSKEAHRIVLKGTRWLLLKNPENLNEDKNEQKRLEEALNLNKPLATVYYMKEDLRTLWGYPDKATAESFLYDWIARAEVSGIAMLKAFAKSLHEHLAGILAYYNFPISTAALEGTNNKIKTMKRQAYGFRDLEFFKLKVMAIHETRYALVG